MSNPWTNAGNWPTSRQPVNQWPQPDPPKPEPAKLDEPIAEGMKKRLTEERLPITPDGILMLWQRCKDKLTNAKEDEMDIRKTAVKVFVPKPKEGMNNVELGGGYTLKAQVNFNYKLADNKIVEECLDKIALLGNEGPFIAARLVSWTPNFLVTEYRALQERAEDSDEIAKKILEIINGNQTKSIQGMLTITEAAPSLEVKEPKVKK